MIQVNKRILAFLNQPFLMLIIFTALIGCRSTIKSEYQRIRDFNSGWSFSKEDTTNAFETDFDDSRWRQIDLPHDWSIEDLPGQKTDEVIGPFTIFSEGARNGESTGHVSGGIGWYRKSFILEKEDINKNITLYFEGAYMESEVWLNGKFLGLHKYGYTPFYFDITTFCNFDGKRNVLAVRIVNNGKNSRWYSGSGIYRNVKLIVTNNLHVAQFGVYITTPSISEQEAQVQVETEIINSGKENSEPVILTKIRDSENKVVGETKSSILLNAGSSVKKTEKLKVMQPRLWSPDSPYLYKLETTILSNGEIIDFTITEFGIRSLNFSAEKGFVVNGKTIELKGGCIHHDNGILGAAAINRAEERRVELLKANGFNAVRCSHNPPSEKFLQTCDQLGILVLDEAFDMWQKPKNPDDYHQFFDSCWENDFSTMILRDRNHPSVILWSIGNEIEERADSSGLLITRKLKSLAYKLDSTRLITEAICEFWDHPGREWQMTAPAFELLDVCGYNYQWGKYESDHQQYPSRIMVGTESVPMHAFENWELVEKHSFVIGDFVWTAMDYLGESGIGHAIPDNTKNDQLMPWPWFNAYCGDIDLIGNKKPQSYFRDVVWNRSKIELSVHVPLTDGVNEVVSYWGWPDEQKNWNWYGYEGKIFDVNVYSRATVVQLHLNNKLIGEKKISETSNLTAKFKVPFEPGELIAIALEDGKEVAREVIKSTGKPSKIRLSADRSLIKADRNELSYINVEILDNNDQFVPDAEISVSFSIEGNGEIAAAGSADPSYMASFKKPIARTFRGRCLVIIRPIGEAGEISLQANAVNLISDIITIRTEEGN